MTLPARRSLFRTMALGAALAGCAAAALQAQSDTSRITLRPTFSLGTGMLGFYGDVGFQSKVYSPLVSQIGYELSASTPVTPWLEASLFALHGRLSANERSTARNLNFESRITTGGLCFTYNFGQFLAPARTVEPWLSVGFESLEFLSKTDLKDAQGRAYHYWSDGSIRNIAEDAPNAEDAVEIHRDYSYESDVRESDLDGFGKYDERSWAVPVGIGLRMKLAHGFEARVGATMHFTLTDMIDGVSDGSIGDRRGDGRNDRFLFTSFSIGYAIPGPNSKKKTRPSLSPTQMDAIALNDDEDGDKVMDWGDRCPHTPAGAAVDAQGCPLDGDADGVPDFRDDELNSAPGAAVDARGVTMDDEDQLRAWLNWKDSANVNIISNRVESFGPVGKPKITRAAAPAKRTYVVKVGSQVEGISEDLIQRILSLPDVRTIERGDTTFYVVGNYDALPEAMQRELQLKGQGFAGDVMIEQNGKLIDLPPELAAKADSTPPTAAPPPANPDEVVVRVQLGAFRHRLSQNIFTGIPDLVTVQGNDGLTRYYTGSFTDVNQAARHKVDMLLKGFEGAFLVAFKDGKRVSIKEAGAQLSGPENLHTIPPGVINKDLLTFRVQVGTFVGNVPMDTMGKFVEIGKVKSVAGLNAVRYLYGEYPTRAAAELARQELQNLGFKDAFVVGEMNGHIIQAEDAEKLLKGQ